MKSNQISQKKSNRIKKIYIHEDSVWNIMKLLYKCKIKLKYHPLT